MSIPTDRLREIASVEPLSGDPVVYERWQLATELLALRDATSLPGYTRLVEERNAARAELAAVKRQRDNFMAFLRSMQDAMHEAINALSLVLGMQAAQDWLSKWSAQAKDITDALAAEQPNPQQPEVQP